MSKYDSLFEKGYYFGDLSEMSFDMNEYNKKCKEVMSFADDKEKYFDYFNIARDYLPHRIPYTERQERLNHLKSNPNIDPFNSSNSLKYNNETIPYLNYYTDLVYNFIPNIYPHLTKNMLGINPGIQMYQDGDYQQSHFDGHIDLCVFILYFSDPSTYNYTGRLQIVEGKSPEKIIDMVDPINGKFAIFDTVNHNPEHRVEKVTGDFKRFSFLGQLSVLK
jgi:Rps23 Pro-64 3,4-dihydroxylase Tpa1-like proline 4-hydroxylase